MRFAVILPVACGGFDMSRVVVITCLCATLGVGCSGQPRDSERSRGQLSGSLQESDSVPDLVPLTGVEDLLCVMDAPFAQPLSSPDREAPAHDFHMRVAEDVPDRFAGFRGEWEPTAPRFEVTTRTLEMLDEYLRASADLTGAESTALKLQMFGD
jgi:hypothetical protein